MAIVSTQLIVEGTLWTLVAFSVATWALILIKGVQQARVSLANRQYKRWFWKATDLSAAAENEDTRGPAARLARAGFRALGEGDASISDLAHSGERQDILERYLRQQLQKERHRLDSGLAILATIGSTAPFVGLFGTVWGIMKALTDIGSTGSASLDVVAGPIGEALVATGVGIAVAVPAVIAYNFFIRRIRLIGADLEDFATDFVNLSQRTGFRIKSAKGSGTASAARDKDARQINPVSGSEVFA